MTTRTLDTTPRYWSNWLSKISAWRAASGSPAGGGIVRDDRVEQLRHALARLRRDAHDLLGRDAEDVLDLGGEAVGVGRREVDLVEHGDDRQVVLEGEVAVGQRLRLDPLGGVDDEHDPLARRQRAAHLVAEVDVAGGVDEVEGVALPLDAHVLRLDRDAPLALELHRVEVLLAHVASFDGSGEFEDAVRQRRLAVVDVGDDREVADAGERSLMAFPGHPGRSSGRGVDGVHQAALAASSLIGVDHTLGGGLVEALDGQAHVLGVASRSRPTAWPT